MPDVFCQEKTGPRHSHGSPDIGLSQRDPESLPADAQGDAPFEYVQPEHARNDRETPVEPDQWEFGKAERHWFNGLGWKSHPRRRSKR